MQDEGMYWTAHGGNGTNLMWASCHEYTSVVKDANGRAHEDKILVDLGQFEAARKIGGEAFGGRFDKIVPDVSGVLPSSESGETKAQALFLTHGHTDHFNGVFEYALAGFELPPVYASEYTLKLLEAGFIERGMDWRKYIEPHVVKEKDVLHFGDMTVEVATAPHSIPGSLGFKISNEKASVFHSGDIKLEETSYIRSGADLKQFAQIGAQGLDFAVMDSCGAREKGHAFNEKQAYGVFKGLFDENANRQAVVVVPPAHVERIATVLQAAKDAGREVVIDGGSVMDAHLLGLQDGELLDKFPNIVAAQDVKDSRNAVVLTSGVFAKYDNEDSPLVRALNKGEKYDKMDDDALVLIAHQHASLKTLIHDSGLYPAVTVLDDSDISGLYAPGHARLDDLKDLLGLLKPAAVAPVHAPANVVADFNKELVASGYGVVGDRPVRNGDTVKIVSGQKPEIVETLDHGALCFTHGVVNGVERVESCEKHTYGELGINTENRVDGSRRKLRASLEEKRSAYRKSRMNMTQHLIKQRAQHGR